MRIEAAIARLGSFPQAGSRRSNPASTRCLRTCRDLISQQIESWTHRLLADAAVGRYHCKNPEFHNKIKGSDSIPLAVHRARQWVDWRALRLHPIDDLAERRAIEQFCSKIVEALTAPTPVVPVQPQSQLSLELSDGSYLFTASTLRTRPTAGNKTPFLTAADSRFRWPVQGAAIRRSVR